MVTLKGNDKFLYINNLLCIACGECIEKCPEKAISEYDSFFTINTDLCKRCGTCKKTCKKCAIGETPVLDRFMHA